MTDDDLSVSRRSVFRVGPGEAADDELAIEEPLEIRAAGETIAVTMRTPGVDRWLVAGFLVAEGLISGREDLARIVPCGRPGTSEYGNVVDAVPAAGVALPLDGETFRRGTLMSSACGVCGRQTIEDLEARCNYVSDDTKVEAAVLSGAVAGLRSQQDLFGRTGGVHAAALVRSDGRFIVCCEDVGRHNAVDKACGALALGDATGTPAILVVSGRASFEIVQKAVVSRVPIVASVSAPSSLAVDLADRFGISLAGFVRAGRFNLYAHPERILSRDQPIDS